MKIYTRGGDEGHTSFFGGERVAKNHPRIEAYGTVDELSSVLGLARAAAGGSRLDAHLASIQSDLFEIGAVLASPNSAGQFSGPSPERVTALEEAIDTMEAGLTPLRAFILPGGSPQSASLHHARTVCRRAERRILDIGDDSDETRATIVYLNRLSDFLFVAARFANLEAGVDDVPWKQDKNSPA
ncbi:MAG TPA: cob(I)yrinic acid a,c-diamide adenosyltransferase [Thermoanaerobaculia bacterium]|nr:cob(I)yrinic acid a,c-diamide adenosyltransferase [Thermoanaerobaculia bacterium]